MARLNKRLGNILFLTPLLRSLAATLPEAQIDVVIRARAHKPLLETLPGIRRVLVQESGLISILRLLHTLRKQRYDLVIDPVGNSASNRIGVALMHARQRMGFAASDQWLRLTHAAPPAESLHQARKSVELLALSVSTPRIKTFDTLAVFPGPNAHQAAAQHWHDVFGDDAPDKPVVGFFSRATGNKMLARVWWEAWLWAVQRQMPDAALLEILPNENARPISPETAHLAIRSLPILAALMSRLDQFVAADSGPMHLAAAAGVPVLGLFRATSPRDYGPLGRDCMSMEGEDLTPTSVANRMAEFQSAARAC